jgi:predicted phage terminase large subunit-like protein
MMMAYRIAWEITKNPAVTVLYISATANLAEKQLKAIKDILTSKIYSKYWPDMVLPEEGKRERWSVNEIAVDHPKRREEGVRDPTVFACGATTTVAGLHCDIAAIDDLVTPENAYTQQGRKNIEECYSYLASIENPEARELVVGTRYFAQDLYNTMMEMKEEQFDEDGEPIGSEPVFEKFERQVEDKGDGTGEFLWPRQRRRDGKWFGFNTQILMKKKAQYIDRTQFYAQYYNDPNDRDSTLIAMTGIEYYDKKHLKQENGHWYFKDRRMNVFAAIDFAFTLTKKADYSAVVVIGVDTDNNYYVLDIARFKTDRIEGYYNEILDLFIRWDFKKLRAEVTQGQRVIVRELKEKFKQEGYLLKIEDYSPTRFEGTKEERILATLQPRYDNQQIYHYRGGNCQILEEELSMLYPPHDDVKDALASAISGAHPPKIRFTGERTVRNNSVFNSRFGGVRFS